MVGFGSFNNTEFVRMVTINSLIEKQDVFHFFDTLEASAESIC